ncbi:MAG TPA: hypothetical protein VN711_03010 [Candidatus Saccharimonadales bacterium]|nr:hypothetical protein [Candidatus Saccharimonadales bacterium]
MAERKIQLFRTQAELLAYLNEQQEAGADNQPYFRRVREGLEAYGEIAAGMKPESQAKLVQLLGILAQVAANGLLEGLEKHPNFGITGVNRDKHPEIGPNIWLNYWLTKGKTQNESGEDLKQTLPDGTGLGKLGDSSIQKQAVGFISVGDNFLERKARELGMPTGEYRWVLNKARGVKKTEKRYSR